jgi:hypothetical protein
MINIMVNVKEAYIASGLAVSDQYRPMTPQIGAEREARLLLTAYAGVWLTFIAAVLAMAVLAVVGIGVVVSWLTP